MDVDRRLSHVELLHAPGERALAARVFELLGCVVVDSGRHWFTAFVDTRLRDWANNVMYASEASAAQLAVEATMDASAGAWIDMVRAAPQEAPHFGFRVGSADEQRAILQRVREAGEHDAELRGRVAVLGLFPHDAPDAIATGMDQAFIWTDVMASGPLRLGQVIEIQWHLHPEGGA